MSNNKDTDFIEIPKEVIDKINKEYEYPEEKAVQVLDPEATLAKLATIEQKINSVGDIPQLLQATFTKYDESVNTRFEMMMKRSSAGSSSTSLLDTIGDIIKNVTSEDKNQGANTELNKLADRIVLMSLRNTMHNVETNLGLPHHQQVDIHE